MYCPKAGERYRHFKGRNYEIVAIATHSETREPMVVYRALYGDYGVYVRPLDMFVSEVDHAKYPDVVQKFRFERIDAKDERLQEEEALAQVDPRLMAFLNAETYASKIEVLESMRDTVTDDLIDAFAAASDLEIKAGSIENRYQELRSCLMTYARFEVDRLR